jgi:hypothetical protein
MPLYNAAMKDKSIIYLLNEEATKVRVIKVFFLDVYGHVVWHNKIRPEGLEVFQAQSAIGSRLYRYLEICYDEPSFLQPGAILEYDE